MYQSMYYVSISYVCGHILHLVSRRKVTEDIGKITAALPAAGSVRFQTSNVQHSDGVHCKSDA